jgi:hypothetical protein
MAAFDISIVTRKAHAARFASSFEQLAGNAGTEKTRKEPARLTDKQANVLKRFGLKYLPAEQRDAFRYSTLNRLSGAVGDAALRAAIIAAAQEVCGFTYNELVALGIGMKSNASRSYDSKEVNAPPVE